MSQFVVSARKYRPQRFKDVVGQAHVSQTLKNALRTEHVAHAFLFCGPRGVGKTTNARILAKILNCTDRTPDYEACGTCDSCRAFDRSASFNIFELDAASNNSVEHIRALVEQTRIPPQQGKYKVFIIDEVHMLSQQAFNAFLKTLEEPPAHAIFILATTEKHKIIPTILSRCQIFDFRRIQIPDTVEHLQKICDTEGITAEPDALHIIAQKSDGALRDALSIFDRIVSASSDRHIRYADVIENLNVLDYDYFFKIIDALLVENLSAALLVFDDVMRKGFDADTFVSGLAEHCRNLLICKDLQTLKLLEVGEILRGRYQKQAQIANTAYLLTALNLLNDCDVNYKQARNKRLHVEMALIKLAYISRAVDAVLMPQNIEKKTLDLSQIIHTGEPPPQYGKVSEAEKLEETDYLAEKAPSDASFDTPKVEETTTEADVPPGPSAVTFASAPASMMTVPQLSSLDDIAKMIEAEEAIIAQAVSKLSPENLKDSWLKYAEAHESPSTKLALRSTELDLDGTEVKARVGSELAVGLVKSELRLADFLRFDLSEPNLTLEIQYDKDLAPEDLTPVSTLKKFLSPREKLKTMMEVNPLVKDLAVKLNLKPDE